MTADKPKGERLPKEGSEGRPVFGDHSLSYADRDSAPALQGSRSLPKRPLAEYVELQRAWREAHNQPDQPGEQQAEEEA